MLAAQAEKYETSHVYAQQATQACNSKASSPASCAGLVFNWTPQMCIQRFQDFVMKVSVTRLGLPGDTAAGIAQREVHERQG